MHRLTTPILFIILFSIHFSLSAEKDQRPHYRLLWKISGKGLKKPSYLFGTMHVRDNKAFDISDSVLLKLEACDAFALEVHPDSLMSAVLGTMLGQHNKPDLFKEHLSAVEYREFDSLLLERAGVPLSNFRDPLQLTSFLSERVQKKDKPTFLDAWLYTIARNRGKIIKGVESHKTQMQMMLDNPSEKINSLKKYLERDHRTIEDAYADMLDKYHAGDIDALRKISLSASSEADYATWITMRNVGMVNNIVREIHKQSIFVAVGAAHLPGEEGLVALLQGKGYEVSIVQPSFTGLVAKYPVETGTKNWFSYVSPDGGYELKMPSSPTPFSPKEAPITFQTSIDLTNLHFYMSTHLAVDRTSKAGTAESFLNEFPKQYAERNALKSSQNISVDGLPGRDLELDIDGNFLRVRLVARDRVIHILIVGTSGEITQSAEAEKFFSSFKLRPLPKEIIPATLEDKTGAFAIKMPGKVNTQVTTPVDPSTGLTYTLHIYHTANPETGETFIFRYNDFPAGYVITNDSIYLNQSLDAAVAKMSLTDLKAEMTTLQGFPSLRFFGLSPDGSAAVKGYILLRGNRYYMAIVTFGAKDSSDAADTYLNSLRFLPYEKTLTKTISLPEGGSMLVPAKFESDSSQQLLENNVRRYSFLDRNSGMAFSVMAEPYSRYAFTANADDYIERVQQALLEEGEEIVETRILKSPMSGSEFLVKSNVVNLKKRIKFWIAGEWLLTLWGYLPDDYVQSNYPEQAFKSFTARPESKWSLFDDKTDLILDDLLSADSATRAQAVNAIYEYEFTTTQLPRIYKAILREYENDEFNRIKRGLIGVLRRTNDSTTTAFIQNIYSELPPGDLRAQALSVLASLKNETNVTAMINLMKADSTHKFEGYTVLNPFYDSLQLFKYAVTDLLALEPRFGDRYTLLSLVKMSLDSNVLDPLTRAKVLSQVVDVGQRIVNSPTLTPDDEGYYTWQSDFKSLATLMLSMPGTSEARNIIEKIHVLGDDDARLTTCVFMLKNKMDLPAADLGKVASNPLYRFQLYDELKKIGQQKRMNSKYLTLKMMAESDLYEYLSYDDGVPDKVEFISEIVVKSDQKVQRLLMFKYQFEGDEVWYSAVTGPYDFKSKSWPERGELTQSFYEVFEDDVKLTERVKTFAEENGLSMVK